MQEDGDARVILKSQNKEKKGVRVLWIQKKAKIIMSTYGL